MFFQVWFLVQSRQTDGKRYIRAHYANCTGGRKNWARKNLHHAPSQMINGRPLRGGPHLSSFSLMIIPIVRGGEGWTFMTNIITSNCNSFEKYQGCSSQLLKNLLSVKKRCENVKKNPLHWLDLQVFLHNANVGSYIVSYCFLYLLDHIEI